MNHLCSHLGFGELIFRIRRDQVDSVVSGREGKFFGSVGRKNNNKNISQIYNMFFSCDKDSAGKGVHIKKCENMY